MIVLIAGCRKQEPARTAGTPPLDKILLGAAPYISQAALMIAEDEGYFREEGIQAIPIRIDSAEAGAALDSGQLDVFAGPIKPGIFNTAIRGDRIRIVAGKGYLDPNQCTEAGFVVRKELFDNGRFGDARSLRGIRVSYSRYSMFEYALELLLAKRGLTLADVRQTKIPSTASIQAFKTGKLDLDMAVEPDYTEILEAGDTQPWIPMSKIVPGAEVAVIVYGPRMLNHPDLGHRFMRAYLKGVRQYTQGKTERNIRIVKRHTKLSDKIVREVCWSAIEADGVPNLDFIDQFVKWSVAKGYVDRVVKRSEYWDPEFVEPATASPH